ncbi:MAG: PIG-L family deacetylase [Thermoleophilia bacterium]
MIGFSTDGVRRVLAIGAHSDDIEIGCGATMLALHDHDPEITFTWVVLTGGPDRQAEAAASAAVFFAETEPNVMCGGLRDGYLPYEDAVAGKELIHRVGNEVAPDLVLTHRRDDMHQDHRFCGDVAHQAFRDSLILEYEIPKFDGDLTTPNVLVPVTRALADRKVRHLMDQFASQRGKGWFTPDTFDAVMRLRGIEAGAPEGLAEGFHVRKLIWRP